MARKGLFQRVQQTGQAVTADAFSRLQDNLRDAFEAVTADHDVLSSPAVTLATGGTIPAGAAIVVFRGGSGQTLTLPPANAQGANTGALLCVSNATAVTVTLVPSRGDTINNSTSLVVAPYSVTPLTSDGQASWLAVPTSGRLLRSAQIKISGTSITHPTGTALIRVRLLAGGGGGGGVAASAAAQACIAGGGGGGQWMEAYFVAASTSSTYVIGAGGTAGASGGGTGGTGGDTTFTHNGTTATAKGGQGGAFAASSAAAGFVAGGGQTTGGSGATVTATGNPGSHGMSLGGAVAMSGAGGNSSFGAGGPAKLTAGAGNGGAGFGSGGSGALSTNASAAAAGGAGAQGWILVEEFS